MGEPVNLGEFLDRPFSEQVPRLQSLGIPVKSINDRVVPHQLTPEELEEITIQLQITAINGVFGALGPVQGMGLRQALGTTAIETTTEVMMVARRLGPAGARRVAPQYNGEAGAMVVQLGKNDCGPACGQQLLREAGVEVLQSDLKLYWYKGLQPDTLAKNLNRFLPGWKGIQTHLVTPEQFATFAASGKGGFIARIGGNPGHFVIVDGVKNSMVLIRDPAAGLAYKMSLQEFTNILSGLVYR